MEPYCDFYCVHCVHMFPLRWVNPQRIFAALLDGFRKTADLRDAFARRFFADRALPYSDGDTYWLWDVVRLCRGNCVLDNILVILAIVLNLRRAHILCFSSGAYCLVLVTVEWRAYALAWFALFWARKTIHLTCPSYPYR